MLTLHQVKQVTNKDMNIRKEILIEVKELLDWSRVEYSYSRESHEDADKAERFLDSQRFSIEKITETIKEVGSESLEAYQEGGSKELAKFISSYILEDRLEAYFKYASEILERCTFQHQIF